MKIMPLCLGVRLIAWLDGYFFGLILRQNLIACNAYGKLVMCTCFMSVEECYNLPRYLPLETHPRNARSLSSVAGLLQACHAALSHTSPSLLNLLTLHNSFQISNMTYFSQRGIIVDC